MNLAPEQLREISIDCAKTANVGIHITENSYFFGFIDRFARLLQSRLFAEFQKLKDSRVSELEDQFAAEKDKAFELVAENAELAAKLKALEDQEPVAYQADDGSIYTSSEVDGCICEHHRKLYAAPVAPSVPEDKCDALAAQNAQLREALQATEPDWSHSVQKMCEAALSLPNLSTSILAKRDAKVLKRAFDKVIDKFDRFARPFTLSELRKQAARMAAELEANAQGDKP